MGNISDLSTNKDSIDKLVFLEFVDEAKVFLRKYLRELQAGQESFKIVSFYPLVKSYLQRHKVPSTDSFHFCPTPSHQKLLLQLEDYIEQVRKWCRLEDSIGVRESYVENLLFSIRPILSTWLYDVEVISNAIENYRPKKVISVGSEHINIARSLWIEPTERYLVDIINQVCSVKKIYSEVLPLKVMFIDLKRDFIKWLQALYRKSLCCFLRLFINPGKNIIIAPFEGHEINRVLKDLRKELDKNYDIAFLGLLRRPTIKDIATSLVRNNKKYYRYLFYDADRKVACSSDFSKKRKMIRETIYKLLDIWSYRDVSPAKWLKLKYEVALGPDVIDKTYCQSANLDKFLDRWRPLFVLSQYSCFSTAVMGELCRLKGVPSLMIPHGSFTPIQDEHSKREWAESSLALVNTPYKYVALQTPLIEKFLRDVPAKSIPIITGPLILGRDNVKGDSAKKLREKYALENEKIVLHAGTPKDRTGMRFLNYETVEEYIDGLSSLVKAVDDITGVHLIIRYRVLNELSEKELRGLLPNSKAYSIASGGSFIDYLSIADLLVSYSSTAIEEALQNNIPVLLFNKYNRYTHISGKILHASMRDFALSAVYNVNSENDLLFALKWIIDNHLFNRDRDLLNGLFDKFKYNPEKRVMLSEFIRDLNSERDLINKEKKDYHLCATVR